MTLGGLLLLVTIIAVGIGFVKIRDQGQKISDLEKKIGKREEGKKSKR
jgi:uncharacterized transporter YbjL